MANMKYRTKGNSNPKGKRRVYFTCHPDDFEKYFDKICEDIFATHNCAIYYTEDMTEEIEEKNIETDLESNNLFVIPVTYKLLSEPNRAMDFDFAFAREKNIPILPIMMESGIDIIYSRKDKFGEMQYLNPNSNDLTAISYKDKLRKYLDAVLISNETEKKVRAAFDAYIFLSYRKKDRHLANKLMKMIHANPEYRDIAIWFDEFLTPGESFRENINKILSDSKLFTLLVTPNLLEKDNFVMREEYPAAVASGIEILPAEMEETDREELEKQFRDIPECSNTKDSLAFRERLLDEISKLAIKENNTPEHNFLIGLAYLDGIDVEVDRTRGIELITGAAEAGLPEAMETLYNMYSQGAYVKLDYNKAVYWAQKIADLYVNKYGKSDNNSLGALGRLVSALCDVGNFKKALEVGEELYNIVGNKLGWEHSNTLTVLSNLSHIYRELGMYTKAIRLNEKAYNNLRELFGEEHPATLSSLNNLAAIYGIVGNFNEAMEVYRKLYSLGCKLYGDEHPDTLRYLNNMAWMYGMVGDYKTKLELNKKAYAISQKVYGENHPQTLITLDNLAIAYSRIRDFDTSLEICRRVYKLYREVLGEEHPDTLISLNNLACAYGEMGNSDKKLELLEKGYTLRCKVFGELHPYTIIALDNLAGAYGEAGNDEKRVEMTEKAYVLSCEGLGEENPDTLITLHNLAFAYSRVENYDKSLELYEKAYPLFCKVYGKHHSNTSSILTGMETVRKLKNGETGASSNGSGSWRSRVSYSNQSAGSDNSSKSESVLESMRKKRGMAADTTSASNQSEDTGKSDVLESMRRMKNQRPASSGSDLTSEPPSSSETGSSNSVLDQLRKKVRDNNK